MNRLRKILIAAALLTSLGSCKRAAESAPAGSRVGEDVKGVAKATEKAAKDLGQATAELAGKAGETGDDAWITTKVKSELTTNGLDPLHVHVDTDHKVVTLSGAVPTAADAQKAVGLAKGVKGVVGVQDHLFVKPAAR